MIYEKIPLTLAEQADQLLGRGLVADRDELIERLATVNYYRLSGYLFPFRNDDDSYRPGTSLELIWNRYVFDRHLRVLILDAIERVEVSIRAALAYEHAHLFGPFGYTIPGNLPNIKRDEFGRFLSGVFAESNRSKEVFIQHFNTKYGDQHGWPPVWMASELMTLGSTLTFFRGADTAVRKSVSKRYGQPDEVMESWLRTLHFTRNVCAHHARLWNRVLGVAPKIPRAAKHPEWHRPESFDGDRVFAVLTILQYLLKIIAPRSEWAMRFEMLLIRFPDIPIREMGIPQRWKENSIWGLAPESEHHPRKPDANS